MRCAICGRKIPDYQIENNGEHYNSLGDIICTGCATGRTRKIPDLKTLYPEYYEMVEERI